jgi:hypothetical protein
LLYLGAVCASSLLNDKNSPPKSITFFIISVLVTKVGNIRLDSSDKHQKVDFIVKTNLLSLFATLTGDREK